MIQNKNKLQEEAKKFLEQKNMSATRILEKWARTDIGRGLKESKKERVDLVDLANKDLNKAKLVASAMNNQEKHLQQLNETTISSDFQTTPENVLKIVKKGVANSCRPEMFTEVSLDTTDDALYFIDMTHSATLTGKEMTAADKIFEKAYQYTAGQVVYKDTVGAGSATFSITLDELPIKPYKVHVLLDERLVAYDDGDGTFTAVTKTGAINVVVASCSISSYTAGTMTIVFDTVIPTTSTVRVVYEFDSEDSDLYAQYPKVTLAISKKRFQATPQPLGYTYSTMTELVLGTTMKEDVEDLLVNAVAAEHSRSRDFKSISLANRVSESNQKYEFNTKFADEGEINYKLHAQRLYNVIDSIGGQIYDSILRGKINTIVAGSNATAYLRNLDTLWKEDTSQPREGVYKAGTLADITVFTCPAATHLVATNEMLLMYKNPLQGLDVSIAFGVLTELTASLAYPQFYIDGNVACVEDSMIITKEFVRKLTLKNLETYTA